MDGSVSVLLHQPGGAFKPTVDITPVQGHPFGMAIGRLDSGNSLDVAVTADDRLNVLLGDSNGNLGDANSYPLPDDPYDVLLTRADSDPYLAFITLHLGATGGILAATRRR